MARAKPEPTERATHLTPAALAHLELLRLKNDNLTYQITALQAQLELETHKYQEKIGTLRNALKEGVTTIEAHARGLLPSLGIESLDDFSYDPSTGRIPSSEELAAAKKR